MKKIFLSLVIVSVALLAFTAFTPNALAQGTPSSKATAAINKLVGCTLKAQTTIGDTVPVDCHEIFTGDPVSADPTDNFVTIMTSTIKVSNSQSLFVSPSLVTGLYTQTKTKTSPGTSSTATAEGGVYLRAIVVDQNNPNSVQVGYPVAACVDNLLGCQKVGGKFGVTLDTRIQTLTQEISNCVVSAAGVITGACTFDSTIDLILKTTSAHTFNFIFPNVGVGVYTVEIQAAVNAGASVTGLGTATGAAAFGLGSLTVESVRMVHDFSF